MLDVLMTGQSSVFSTSAESRHAWQLCAPPQMPVISAPEGCSLHLQPLQQRTAAAPRTWAARARCPELHGCGCRNAQASPPMRSPVMGLSQSRSWEIEPSRLTVARKVDGRLMQLGRGAFGTVRLLGYRWWTAVR